MLLAKYKENGEVNEDNISRGCDTNCKKECTKNVGGKA